MTSAPGLYPSSNGTLTAREHEDAGAKEQTNRGQPARSVESRLAGFYRLAPAERLQLVASLRLLDDEAARAPRAAAAG